MIIDFVINHIQPNSPQGHDDFKQTNPSKIQLGLKLRIILLVC